MTRDEAYEMFLEWRGIDKHNGDIVCKKCNGSGVRAYGSTATWHGGIGGQIVCGDICDKCWGSGIENKPWFNLRGLNKGGNNE